MAANPQVLGAPAMFVQLVALMTLLSSGGAPLFSPTEVEAILAYWNAPGRYAVAAPTESVKSGPWQVRLTVEGSLWFWNYQMAIGAGKTPPTQAPLATGQFAAWEAWVSAKVEHDRFLAGQQASVSNAALIPSLTVPALQAPTPSGPIPPELLAALGNPPPFAAAVAPLQHTVTFDDGEPITYADRVKVGARYAYFRFPQGVMHPGTPLKSVAARELDELYAATGLTPFEQRVMRAVSRHEGGFESVNTYDTGFVSVGFIQFACLEAGGGSLGKVLLREKFDNAAAFAEDFRRYGVDADENGLLAVVDPATGAELHGPAAARKIVDDKRLIAVFQRAGKRSQAFRLAQLVTARALYYPADDAIVVTVNGQSLSGKVSDAIRSEAGMATLFDRKVNRGNIDPFREVLARVMTERGLASIGEAAKWERAIVAALKYREDFLADPGLSQPP
jgi:hypothetical protein